MSQIIRRSTIIACALGGLLVAHSAADESRDPCCSACANHQHATTSTALSDAKQIIAEHDQRSLLAPPTPIGQDYRVVKAQTGCAPATLAQRQVIEQLRAEIVAPVMIDPFQHVRMSNRMRDPSRSAGLNIEYILSTAVAADQDFVDGLLRGAEYWEDMINSEATLVVFVGFTSNQPFLAAASTTLYGWNYPSIRSNTIAAAAPTVADYVSALPEVLSYQKAAGPGDTISNNNMVINNAVYQALGFPSLIGPGDNDGFIVFNTDFDFDPDPSDGITPGFRDLVYIMIHELGHALGFTSTVDTGNGPNFFNSLDMFRLGTLGAFNEPSTLAEFSDFDRELRPGVEAAIARVGFFQNILGPLSFSTGSANGDGRQASHWKDDAFLGLPLPIGVMDPTYNGDQIPPGYVTDADRLAFSLIGWDIDAHNCRWAPLNTGINGAIRTLTSFNDGSGNAVFAAGDFSEADGIPAPAIARWDGAQWTTLTSNLIGSFDTVHAIQPFNTDLYIAGDFATAIIGGQPAFNIARWNGTAWNNLGSGFDGPVYALAVFDDGSGAGEALYASGEFSAILDQNGTPTTPASNIARWDGTQWSPLSLGTNGPIRALTVHNDGSGSALYAAGNFTEAGGASAASIARWNGTSWSAVSAGLADTVYALAVFDDGNGSGPALYAGGDFSFMASPPDTLNRIARWDGAQWTPLADGLNNTVRALHVFDNDSGDGPALYVGGDFTTAGGVSASRVARWNGNEWSRLWVGMTDTVLAFTTFDDGTNIGQALYAGGDFIGAGGQLANRIAQWGCTNWAATGLTTPCPGDINADGIVNLADFNILAVNFGVGPGATLAQGDLNGDGFVNLADFNILAVNFGNDCN